MLEIPVQSSTDSADLANEAVPPLVSGDRLSRAEFERRYWLHPEIKKAELIERRVYVASPLYHGHGRPHLNVSTFIGTYVLKTEGLIANDNTSIRLDGDNEIQPDTAVYIAPEYGGKTLLPEDDFIEGAPEFVIEVARSSASYDLFDKKRVYQRNGMPGYVVLSVYDKRTHWFELIDGVYAEIQPDENGIFKSNVLPGFWFDGLAYWREDWKQVFKALDEGMNSAEYHQFQQQLISQKQP